MVRAARAHNAPVELDAPNGKTIVMTDAELIAASLTEPARFAELFDRHFAAVFRFAERRVGYDQAGEVASETFTRAFARRHAYRGDVPDALPWLYGIASNLVLHERRRFARYLAAVERAANEATVAELDGGVAAADRRLDAPGDWERMRRALLALNDTDRELLLLVAWDELSYEGAAAVLGLQVGTVRSKLHRAKARLRELLEASGRTPSDKALSPPKEASLP
jgi:RNA polymerase sigma-70 factor (ECF subfamily)